MFDFPFSPARAPVDVLTLTRQAASPGDPSVIFTLEVPFSKIIALLAMSISCSSLSALLCDFGMTISMLIVRYCPVVETLVRLPALSNV